MKEPGNLSVLKDEKDGRHFVGMSTIYRQFYAPEIKLGIYMYWKLHIVVTLTLHSHPWWNWEPTPLFDRAEPTRVSHFIGVVPSDVDPVLLR
jgi:hypothetical protein